MKWSIIFRRVGNSKEELSLEIIQFTGNKMNNDSMNCGQLFTFLFHSAILILMSAWGGKQKI